VSPSALLYLQSIIKSVSSYPGPFTWQDILDAIHPDSAFSGLAKGMPGSGKNVTHPILLDTTKTRMILGLEFRELDETAKDSAKDCM